MNREAVSEHAPYKRIFSDKHALKVNNMFDEEIYLCI